MCTMVCFIVLVPGLKAFANFVLADCCFFCFKRKTAYEMRISDWSSDVCSSDLEDRRPQPQFLRTGAERDIELDPPLIIGAPAERVVDLAAIVVAGVDHRIERIIGRGIADDARTDAANVETAHLR